MASTNTTALYRVSVNVSLAPGITAAALSAPNVGLLLRLGVACDLGVQVAGVIVDRVLSTDSSAASVALSGDALATINAASGQCSVVGARRLAFDTTSSSRRVIRDLAASSPCTASGLSSTTTVGVSVLVDGMVSNANVVSSHLGGLFGAPETAANGTLRAFLVAAANASGIPQSCAAFSALQSPPSVASVGSGPVTQPPPLGSANGPASSAGASSSLVIISVSISVALLCCALFAGVCLCRMRRRKAPLRRSKSQATVQEYGVNRGRRARAAALGSSRFIMTSNPLQQHGAVSKGVEADAVAAARGADTAGVAASATPVAPLTKARSYGRLTAPFMLHNAAAAVHAWAGGLAGDEGGSPHRQHIDGRVSAPNPLHRTPGALTPQSRGSPRPRRPSLEHCEGSFSRGVVPFASQGLAPAVRAVLRDQRDEDDGGSPHPRKPSDQTPPGSNPLLRALQAGDTSTRMRTPRPSVALCEGSVSRGMPGSVTPRGASALSTSNAPQSAARRVLVLSGNLASSGLGTVDERGAFSGNPLHAGAVTPTAPSSVARRVLYRADPAGDGRDEFEETGVTMDRTARSAAMAAPRGPLAPVLTRRPQMLSSSEPPASVDSSAINDAKSVYSRGALEVV